MSEIPTSFLITYESFLKYAEEIFSLAENDELFDLNLDKLKKSSLTKGLFLGMKINEGQFIGVKIGIGTQKHLKEVFS